MDVNAKYSVINNFLNKFSVLLDFYRHMKSTYNFQISNTMRIVQEVHKFREKSKTLYVGES